MLYYLNTQTPLGNLTLISDEDSLRRISFDPHASSSNIPDILQKAEHQLRAYFNHTLKHFTVPLKPEGTPFQQKVWQALQDIEYGQVKTYLDIASQLKTAPRAVGMMCGKNPLLIFIPCHRVVAVTKKLQGFSAPGGIQTKSFLLKFEGYKDFHLA
jgi:methylated-DNA-[protein]-cysteine S-methyltransferase